MAMSEMLGGSLLGFQQGLAQQDRLNQLAGFQDVACTNTFTTTATTANTGTLAIYGNSGVSVPCESVAGKKSIRQELQAEVDEWLPRLAA